MESLPGYGFDHYTESAKAKIRKACGMPDADVEFLVGGTQTNAVVISTMLNDWEGVISAESGHVNVTVTLSNANYSLATNTTNTTVDISKADAPTLADVTDTLLYTATSVSKSVAGVMPEGAGNLTYAAGSAA